MELKKSTRQAYSELYGILEYLDEETRNKVPLKLREVFKNEKDNEYFYNIDFISLLNKKNLKKETLALIALLNLQYWCDDEEEKKRLRNVYSSNEDKYQNMIKEKYSIDNLFKNNNEIELNKNLYTDINRKMNINKKNESIDNTDINVDDKIFNVYKKNVNNEKNQYRLSKEENLIDLNNVKWYKKFWSFILKIFHKK